MNDPINNETVIALLADLGMDASYTSTSLLRLANAQNRHLKDLKLNVATVLGSANMTRKEACLLALSVVVNEKHEALIAAFEGLATTHGAVAEEIAETQACASVMAGNNIFYRFRHFMHTSEYYNRQPAGLRMSIMMNPVMGKGLFELMSLALSAVNGCERCVLAHEHSVKEHGAGEARIYDAVRLASVIKSLCVAL
jgi:lipoyl-dependent peroxiredoxin subunit D